MQYEKAAAKPVADTSRRLPAARTAAPATPSTLADRHPEVIAQRKLLQMMAKNPRVVAQRELNERIHGSPRMVDQRRQLRGLFGEASQSPCGQELQMKAAPSALPHSQTESRSPLNPTGLPDNLKAGVESLSGLSLDNVKVHYNSAQPALLNALAYAQGSDIHVAPRQEQHLPHEAWHVVQQAQGRVKPSMQLKGGVPVNDDAELEHEADAMGAKALSLAAQLAGGPEKELQQERSVSVQRVDAQPDREPRQHHAGPPDKFEAEVESLADLSLPTMRVNADVPANEVAGLEPKAAVMGAKAVQRRPDRIATVPGTREVVQRRMGIEAEMSVPAPQHGNQGTADERIVSFLSGSQNPGQQVQAPNHGFEIETDHDQLGTEIEGVRVALNNLLPVLNQIPLVVGGHKVPNLEYKTDPFDEETVAGRTAFLNAVDAAAQDMALKYMNAHVGQVQVGGYRLGVPPLADWLAYAANCRALGGPAAGITNGMVQAMRNAIMQRMRPNLYLQVTAGILPNKISKHMKKASENRDVASLRNTISHGADAMEKLLTAGAATTAESAMKATGGLTRAQKRSSSLHGFLSLVVSYLYGNYIYYNGNTVGKNLVPFLGKTPLNEAQRELDVANRPDQLAPATRNGLAANIQNRVVARVGQPDVAAFWPSASGIHTGGPLGNWQGIWLPQVLDGTADAFSVNQLAGRTINPEDHARSKDITTGPNRVARNAPAGPERMGVIPLEFRHIEGSPDPAGLHAFVQRMIDYVRSINQ